MLPEPIRAVWMRSETLRSSRISFDCVVFFSAASVSPVNRSFLNAGVAGVAPQVVSGTKARRVLLAEIPTIGHVSIWAKEKGRSRDPWVVPLRAMAGSAGVVQPIRSHEYGTTTVRT